jgi:hypothetical protein
MDGLVGLLKGVGMRGSGGVCAFFGVLGLLVIGLGLVM